MTNKNESPEEFEARMIARFNKRVNQPETSPEQGGASAENTDPNKTTGSKDDVQETGGPKGLEPTRYGDWEAKGRCHDF